MSYYPKQYPVLEKTEWRLDSFAGGEFDGTVDTSDGLQLSPGVESGTYVGSVIDAGQAVAWRELAWEADVPDGSSVAVRIRSGRLEDGRRSCRWSAKYTSSPACIRLFGSIEGGVRVAADRFLQIRVEMRAGPGGSPRLTSLAVRCGIVPPACVGPRNHAILSPGAPAFYWTRVEGAAGYCFELSDRPDFSNLLHRCAEIAAHDLRCPEPLAEGTYHWRVRAVDGAGGWSAFSPARQFEVREIARADYSHLRHPYLYFTAEGLPDLRKRLQTTCAEPWRKILDQANKALDAPLPDEKAILLEGKSQHGGFHELSADVAYGMLIPLSLAYIVTEDSRYAVKGRELLLFFVGMSRWTGAKFGDADSFYPTWDAALETSTIAKHVTLAYDWLHGYLDEQDRARVREGILRLGLLPLLESWADPETVRFTPRHQTAAGNWYSVCNSGGGLASLGLINEVEAAQDWLRIFADSIRDFLSHQGGDVCDIHLRAGHGEQDLLFTEPNWDDDGGYNESIGYSHYGLLSSLHFLYPLKRITGEDMVGYINPTAVDFPYYFGYWAEDGTWATVPFNDSRGVNWSDSIYAYLAALSGSGRAKYLLDATWPVKENVFSLLIGETAVEPVPPGDADCNKLFRRIGWSVFRSGWDREASLLAAKFTQGRGHGDIGQYVINFKGREFVIDSEISKYTDPHYHAHSRTSWAHNVVIVDDQVQIRVDGEVLGWAGAPGAGIVEAELTTVYQDLVESWIRTLLYVEPGLFVVIDRLASEEERKFNWLVHPKGDIGIGPGSGATFTQDDTELRLLMLSPEDLECVTYDGYVGSTPARYLGFTTRERYRTAVFVAAFVGGAVGREINVEQTGEGEAVRARIATPEADYTLFVNADGAAASEGWGLRASGSICAVAESRLPEGSAVRWVLAGPGPLKSGGRLHAPLSHGSPYRAASTNAVM